MTTEQKALALDQAAQAAGSSDWKSAERCASPLALASMRAHARTIEAHEADNARNEQRLADQAKAFSDAITAFWPTKPAPEHFQRFILPDPEPDPLVEIAREMTLLDGVVRTDSQKAAIREGRAGNTASDDFYDRLRMALPPVATRSKGSSNEQRMV